jgi:hypothetical protein
LFGRNYKGSKEGITTPEASIMVNRVLHNLFLKKERQQLCPFIKMKSVAKLAAASIQKLEKKRVHIQIDWNELQPMA